MQDVLSHLLFHKALLDDREDAEQINRYINLVRSSTFDIHSIKDPFDRSIVIVLQLAAEQQINPWDIDLVNFSLMYLKRAKEQQIDLVVAGRIILMAWTVLRIQSEDLIASTAMPQQDIDVAPDWTEMSSWDGSGTEYNARVINGEAPIDEKIRRKGDRKVTLIELIKAFEEAKKEAQLHQQFEDDRKRQVAITNRKLREGISERVDKEEVEEGINIVWERISRFNGHQIPLKDLYDSSDRDDFIRTLVSTLFLASDKYGKKIKIWQKDFPYGQIFVKNMHTS